MSGIRRVSQLGTTGESTYVDGSIQAVDIAANAITQDKLSTDIPLSGFRNLIINGNMVINQRNTSLANSGYSVDRWALQKFGSGTAISVAQSTDAPPNFTNSLKMTTAFGAAETSAWFYQRVEGHNAAPLGFGTASAKQVTVSFWVKSSLSGTYSVTLQNDQKTRVYAASYTISAANTWEYKTVTIPGDTTGTWLKTTDSGLDVFFPFGTNGFPSSAYVAPTLDAWFTGAGGMAFYVGTSATPNVMATTGNIFAITGVQLEANPQATPFEQRPIGTELALCQRYFQKSYNQDVTVPTNGQQPGIVVGGTTSIANNQFIAQTRFPVSMRTSPTIVIYSYTSSQVSKVSDAYTGVDQPTGTVTMAYSGSNSFMIYNTSGVALTSALGQMFHFTASSEL